MLNRPMPTECAPYYNGYINEVPEGDIIKILREQFDESMQSLKNVGEGKALYRYDTGKWSIKELIGHLIDVERVFAYRALCFSRNEKMPLPSMEQDDYVRFADFDRRPIGDLLEEFRHVRVSSICLFAGLNEEMQMRKGIASGFVFTTRTIPYIIAGHERHHRRILKERYL